MERQRCKHRLECTAEIFFVETANKKFLPLDARPFRRDVVAPEGRWQVILRTGQRPLVTQEGTELLDEVYVAHFATCPATVNERERKVRRGTQPALMDRLEEYIP